MALPEKEEAEMVIIASCASLSVDSRANSI